MKLRRLNASGIDRMGAFLDLLDTHTDAIYPDEILTSAETSEAVSAEIEIERESFSTRFEAAKYLDGSLSNAKIRGIDTDKGLWAWLSLFFFEQICPPAGDNGRRTLGERARWIPAFGDARRYYRHLLAGPYRIYRANRDDPSRAMILLYGPLTTVGHFAYQIASRQEYVTNKTVLEVATELYFDFDTKRPKRGAQTRGQPGTVFRFVDVLNQLDATWDLYSMEKSELMVILPSEFGRFMDQ